jgi:hypothetical protein
VKPHPILILVAVVAGGWLFIQLAGACISLLGVGLGCEPGFAVIAGFLLAVGLAIHALSKK